MGHDRFVLTTDVLARMTARKEGRCENSPGLFLWAKNRPRDHRTNNLVLLNGRIANTLGTKAARNAL